MTHVIRILVADDHPVVRDGLVAMLATQRDFAVIAEAATGPEAVQQASAQRPDIILLDLEMPGLDGVQVIQRLQDVCPTTRILVFTAFDTDDKIVGAVRAGAHGYLLKGVPRDELFRAIRLVSEGGSLLQPIVATKLMQHVSGRAALPALPEPLTEREMDVLNCLALGRSNKEIAAQLSISERTVKFHMSAILGKLNAANRTEALTLAAQHGLITLARK
jgi:DNA-binding NarL/FixJ family response regulator